MKLRQPPWQPRAALAALLLASCSDSCDTTTSPGAIGELGNGRFDYACVGKIDPACEGASDETIAGYFPTCIAIGGRFDLDYDLLDDSVLESNDLSPVLYIESVNQSFFSGSGERYEARRVGRAALVVRESERVLDLIHLDIVEPDGLELIDPALATATTTLEVAAGDTVELRVYPRSSSCAELGGTVEVQVASSDPSVVTATGGDVLRVRGEAPGAAVLRTTLGALEVALAVTVTEGSVDPGTTTSTDGDGSTTAGGSASEGSGGTSTSDPTAGSGGTTDASGSSTGGSTTGAT